ncbi:hypothetical protein Tco_1465063 [Tanacetum coccineum]
MVRKKDEPKEDRILESNEIESENHNYVVEDDKMVEKESKDSKIIAKEEEPNDIGNDDRTSDLEDETFKDETKIEEEGEWMEYEPPIDLVDVPDESVYESLIEKMLSCSLNFDFRIEKRDPSNLKIPCMIGHKFIANVYINLDLPMTVMSLAYYNAIMNQGYEHRGLNSIGIRKDRHVFVRNMSHVMDFTILENVEANIDPSLSQEFFGRPFVETTKLILDKGKGLITFMDEVKEVTFKIPYRDSEMDV